MEELETHGEPSFLETILNKSQIKTEPDLHLDEPEVKQEIEVYKYEIKEEIEGDAEFEYQSDAPDFVQIVNSETPIESHLQCSDCSQMFAEQPQLELHSVVHKPVIDNNRHTCPICLKDFSRLKFKSFEQHIRIHILQFVRCPFCPAYFFNTKLHITHVSDHKKREKLFCCSFCDKKFHSPKEKIIHERVHTNERPYECQICKKGFKQAGSVKTHINNVHNERKDYKCNQCDGFFATTSSLNRHKRKIHDQGKSIPCRLCGAVFYNFDAFHKHQTDSHLEKKFFKVCPICGEPFFSSKQYTRHGKTHPDWHIMIKERQKSRMQALPRKDRLDETVYEEILNSENSDSKLKLRKPKSKPKPWNTIEINEEVDKGNTASENDSSQDEMCVKKNRVKNGPTKNPSQNIKQEGLSSGKIKTADNSNKESVLTLKKIKSEKEEANDCTESEDNFGIQCPECNEIFPNKSIFDLHYTIHTFDNTKVNKCPICFREFTLLHFYGKHIEKHIDLKVQNDVCDPSEDADLMEDCETECVICLEVFPNKALCELHAIIHTAYDNELICPCCCKRFSVAKYFEEHVQKHVEQKISEKYKALEVKPEPSEEISQFKCLTCQEEFEHKDMLDFHSIIHIPNSVFQCQVCIKKYTHLGFFKEHVRNHIKNTIKCKSCPKVFFSRRHFSNHIKIHVNLFKKHQCRHCDESFHKLYKRDAHECEVHNVDNGKKIECNRCLRVFYDLGTYQAHVRYAYTCQICNQVFCKVDLLKKHRIDDHIEQENKLQCKNCDIEFTTEREYRLHFLENHSQSFSRFIRLQGTGSSSISGDGTDEDLSNMDTTKYGESDSAQLSSSPEKTPFNYSALADSLAENHSIPTEKDEGKYDPNDDGNKNSSENENLNFETNTQLASSESDVGYKCDQCGKRFFRAAYFKKHLQNHLFLKTMGS